MHNHSSIYSTYSLVPASYFESAEYLYGFLEQMSLQICQQREEICNLRKENQSLKSILEHLPIQKTSKQPKQLETLQNKESEELLRKSKPRRTFCCQYDNCDRVYASSLALNLHIKTKHNGGIKKERDAYAKLIALAEIKGQSRPNINLDFPRNCIQNIKKKLLSQQNNLKNQ